MSATRPTVGALFAGYGGLERGLAEVLPTRTEWVAEFDAAPSRILAHRYPDAPNLGDVTKVKWTPDCPACGHRTSLYWVGEDAHRAYWCREHGEFPLSLRDDEMARIGVTIAAPVDIITGGSPCQDLSHAGKRAGMKAGTRSGLWASMCDAIDTIRPSLVLWENVRGAYSASADSAVEPCPICVGDRPGVTLRALGRVLGDLAELGYDAAWTGLRSCRRGCPARTVPGLRPRLACCRRRTRTGVGRAGTGTGRTWTNWPRLRCHLGLAGVALPGRVWVQCGYAPRPRRTP